MAVKNLVQFLQEVKSEFSKVIWPQWAEFVGSVLVVLIFVSFFAIYLGVLDIIFSAAARLLFRWYIGF